MKTTIKTNKGYDLYEEIYKCYKHGGNLNEYPVRYVHAALKENGLQVVAVKDLDGSYSVWNYLPEHRAFEKIV